MYHITRNSNQQFFDRNKRKWVDSLEEAKGYINLNPALMILRKQIKIYSDYFQDEEKARNFLSLTYSDPSRIVYNFDQKIGINLKED